MKHPMIRLACVLIALLLPFSALAAENETPSLLQKALDDGKQVVTTITFTPGEELSEIPAVVDLAKALAIQWVQCGDEGAITLVMEEEEVFTASLRATNDGLFADAPSLYDQPMFFALEDLQKLMESMQSEMDSSASFPTPFAGMQSFGAFGVLGAAEDPDEDFSAMTEDELRAYFLKVLGGDEGLADWCMDIYKRAVVTEDEFTGDAHDPANLKVEIVLTKDDIRAICDSDYMYNSVRQQLATESPSKSASQLDRETKESIEDFKAELAQMDILVPLTMLYADDDLVSYSIPGSMRGKQTITDTDGTVTEKTVNYAIGFEYNRLTTEEKVAHTARMTVAEEGKSVFDMDGYFYENKDGSYDLSLVMAPPDEEKLIIQGTYKTEGAETTGLLSLMLPTSDKKEYLLALKMTTGETAVDTMISLYEKKDPTALMTLTDADKPLISFNVNAQVKDADSRFDAIRAATKESSVEPLKLSGEGLEAFTTSLSSNGTKLAFAILAKVPASIYDLFLTTQTQQNIVESDDQTI